MAIRQTGFSARVHFSFLLLFFSFAAAAQVKKQGFTELFQEAAYHVEYKNFSLALPIYLQLDSLKPDNANIQYRIGFCYLNSATEKAKAISYLIKAINHTTGNYDDLSAEETHAPVDAYFQLGLAYHLNYRLDTAIGTFNVYKTLIPKKHIRQEETDRCIEMCRTAKELIADSLNVIIENLGDALNTPYPEYCPVITTDESMLIFTSRRDNSTGGATDFEGKYMEDVYIAMSEYGAWSMAASIGTSINTPDHDAAIGLSHDGQTLFLYRDDDGDGNIYQSELMGDIWTIPEKLSSNINSPSWETHASLSADGQTLFFVSDRQGGSGGRDIYLSKKQPDGEWKPAQNLGTVINTKFDEDAPFIQADGKTLYFSSKGHKIMGGFDIFYSELTTGNLWTEPKNIGYPLNTVDDDIYFVLTADGKKAYFSSIRQEGYGDKDIYKATLMYKQAAPLTVLKGTMSVEDYEKNPIQAEISVIDKSTGEELQFRPNSKTGKYLIILETGKEYDISYLANNNPVHAENFFIPEGTSYQEIQQAIELKPVTSEGVSPKSYTATEKHSTAGLTEPVRSVSMEPVSAAPAISPPPAVSPDTVHTSVPKKLPGIEIKGEFFEQHFGYNLKEVDTSAIEYGSFIKNIASYLVMNDKVNLRIEAVASKVPTAKFKTNEALAQARGEEAKAMLIKSFKSRKISPDKISFKIVTKVEGPDYAGDAKNSRKYEKFQYVKVIVQ